MLVCARGDEREPPALDIGDKSSRAGFDNVATTTWLFPDDPFSSVQNFEEEKGAQAAPRFSYFGCL